MGLFSGIKKLVGAATAPLNAATGGLLGGLMGGGGLLGVPSGEIQKAASRLSGQWAKQMKTEEEEKRERLLRPLRFGRGSTFATSPLGLSTSASVATQSLLGG